MGTALQMQGRFQAQTNKKKVNLPYCSYAVKPPYEAFLTRVVVILKIVLVLCENILDA